MSQEPVIVVKDVYKDFNAHRRANSIKDLLVYRDKKDTSNIRHILKDINFEVKKGEVLGIIGRNGSGKSTTLKLLSRILRPNKGTITINGKVACLIELGAGFHPDMTGRENIYINASFFGISEKEVNERMDDIIEFSGIGEYIDERIRNYSSGMYLRLAFSVAINVDADVLLIDEILAVGDVQFQQKCFDKLRQFKEGGGTIVLVTHSMDQAKMFCDNVIWIDEGVIRESGTAKTVCDHYMEDMLGEEEEDNVLKKKKGSKDFPGEKELRLAFATGGGLGDDLIFANYLKCLKRKFSDLTLTMDVYFSLGYGMADALFEEGDLCRKTVDGGDHIKNSEYDCIIWFCRYPKVEWMTKRVKAVSPEFYEYVMECKAFYKRQPYLFDGSPYLDGYSSQLSIMKGVSRLQQPDFNGALGIGKDYEYNVFIRGDPFKFLKNNGIEGKYITVHRGNDTAYSGDAVKLWPLENYEELIRMFKEKYPGYKVVQMGVSRDRCQEIRGVDIDLVGKTTLDDVKSLLKYSSLHIDSEGGFTHLRQSLRGGQSVALFGPTDIRFYGYDNNINIKGDGCDTPCEWATKSWMTVCSRGYGKPPCMRSITPEMVMERIEKEWNTKD